MSVFLNSEGIAMKKYNILLLAGGKSSEHDVSLVSSGYLETNLKEISDFNVIKIIIGKDGIFRDSDNHPVEINFARELVTTSGKTPLDFVVPCIHGFPGETGDIQSWLEMIELPYLGCGSEASKICFNKITTKLWFDALGIPNTPYLFLNSMNDLPRAEKFMKEHKNLFIKAASQGSSVGCYPAHNETELKEAIVKAFTYSNQVVVEILVQPRELEVSAYEYKGEIHTTLPGEIVVPKGKFYSFDEKYAQTSETTTEIVAKNVPPAVQEKIREYAKHAFIGLKLRHLSRIDFFYTDDGKIYLNEINTFPGMTPISMFPKMLINNGHSFKDFLESNIRKNLK